MHRMTRRVGRAEMKAPFDDSVFHIRSDTVRMEQHDGRRFMRLDAEQRESRLYRITKVIGGRYREDFVGVDVSHADDPATDRGHGAERLMPVSYVFSTRSWRYKGYSVMTPERPALRVGATWAATCIACHNTLPYLALLYDDLYGEHAPSYQGHVADHLLPPSRAWQADAIDEPGLKRAVAAEIEALGGPRPELTLPLRNILAQAMVVTRRKLQGNHLIEVGVGCESCHGGARAHAEDPRALPSFEPTSPLLRVHPSSGKAPTHAERINRTCAHCHTVLFSEYPWTWEGGRRKDPIPGGSTTNSGEARDFLLGGCSSQMSCVQCHDPHAEDRKERLQALEGEAGRSLCTSCHRELASPVAVAAHTHHRADGSGSSCIACHMPRKNMGLTYTLSRYHRIGSPTDQARVLGDRPLECALCHADHSVEDLVATMERFWNKRYDREALQKLYGDDLTVNVLTSTLARGKPHEQAAAIGVLGEQHATQALPLLAAQLAHQYPLVRYFAKHAIETITGEALSMDVNAPALEVAAQAREWIMTYPQGHPDSGWNEKVPAKNGP